MLDYQRMLDETYDYYVVQGHPRGYDGFTGQCAYHTSDGDDTPCAIGRYDTGRLFEGYRCGVLGLPDRLLSKVFTGFKGGDVVFLAGLQRWHDKSFQEYILANLIGRFDLQHPARDREETT